MSRSASESAICYVHLSVTVWLRPHLDIGFARLFKVFTVQNLRMYACILLAHLPFRTWVSLDYPGCPDGMLSLIVKLMGYRPKPEDNAACWIQSVLLLHGCSV